MPPGSKSRTGALAATPSFADAAAFARAWESVQAALADLPGDAGVRRRSESYAPFFLHFGQRIHISAGCRFFYPQRIALEDDARFNEGALVYGSGGVRIGRHARIGPRFFLHSANHEITPSPLAFFERGYDYATVHIGDNCLISANVTVLPGASLGANTFVAAGAVVTGRDYPDDARLCGVPARPLPSVDSPGPVPMEPAPVVLVRGRADDPRLEAMRRIAATLGLPQVLVAEGSDDRTAAPVELRLDASIRPIDGRPGHAPWRLVTCERPTRAAGTAELVTETGERFSVSARRVLTSVPAVDLESRDSATGGSGTPRLRETAVAITLYNAIKRFRKRTPTPSDEFDLLLAARLLRSLPQPAMREPLQHLLDALQGGAAGSLAAALRSLRNGSVDPACDEALIERVRVGGAALTALKGGSTAAVTAKALGAVGELLPLAGCLLARNTERPNRETELVRLAELAEPLLASDKAHAVALAGAFGALSGRDGLLDRAADRLLSAAFLDGEAGAIRSVGLESSPSSSPAGGYDYHAIVGAVLAIRLARDGTLGPTMGLEREHVLDTSLHVLPSSDPNAAGPVSLQGMGLLACSTTGEISASLVDRFVEVLTPPELDGRQLELTDAMYDPLVPALLAAWRAIFRSMILGQGEPFIEVLPWPEGRHAAVSVRYDIDRPTLHGQVRKSVGIQQQSLGAPCGSWYAIPGTEHGRAIEGTLRQHLQEVGVHAVRSQHRSIAGLGVTSHSAPGSEYWRGHWTVAGHAKAGARYTELLTGGGDRPMPAWMGRGRTPPDGDSPWVTPLHFPLEGSTKDTDLGYFDRLRDRFLARIRRGGHVIIGTHPDLNQDLLTALAGRGELESCWCATVEDVVERCRRLFAVGALGVVRLEGDPRPHLCAKRTVADVAIRIERAAGESPSVRIVQLNAGQPRPLEASS